MKKIIRNTFCFTCLSVLVSASVIRAEAGVAGDTDHKGTFRLPEITITATKEERDWFNTPPSVSVIGEEEIRTTNLSTTPDLFLKHPGVLIQKTNHGGGSPFIRGLTGKHILLLIDGVRLNNSLYRFGPHQYLNTIDPNQIERIEVVKGPASVLYGSDALGGVINVITKKRGYFDKDYDIGGLIHGGYGSADNHYLGRLQVSGNLGAFGLVSGISYKDFNHLRGGGEIGKQIPTGYEEFDIDLKMNYRVTPRHELILAEQYVRQFDVPKTSEVTLGNKIKFNYEPQTRSLTYLEYRGRHLIDPYVDILRLNISYNIQEEGEEVIKDDPDIETRELNKASTIGATLHLSSYIGKYHTLSCGVDYYLDKIKSAKEEIERSTGTSTREKSAFPDDSNYQTLGIYIQDAFKPLERLEFILGGRYNQISSDGRLVDPNTGDTIALSLDTDNISGSLSTIMGLTDHINLVGGVSQGFRAPNMEDFFGKVDFTTEIPNTDLEPETSINYEVGVKAHHSKLSGEIFYFLSDYEDLISRTRVGFNDRNNNGTQDEGEDDIVQRLNIGKSRIQGAEFSLTYRITSQWSAYGNCAWTLGEDRDTGDPLRRIPPLMGSLGIKFTAEKYWIEYYSVFAGKQDRLSGGDRDDRRIPEGGTPGYITCNLKGGATLFEDNELVLTVENMFDKKYKTHGSGVYMPGLNIMASYKVSF